jgi:hypothetical protein
MNPRPLRGGRNANTAAMTRIRGGHEIGSEIDPNRSIGSSE